MLLLAREQQCEPVSRLDTQLIFFSLKTDSSIFQLSLFGHVIATYFYLSGFLRRYVPSLYNHLNFHLCFKNKFSSLFRRNWSSELIYTIVKICLIKFVFWPLMWLIPTTFRPLCGLYKREKHTQKRTCQMWRIQLSYVVCCELREKARTSWVARTVADPNNEVKNETN